jgi:hypothetical protein
VVFSLALVAVVAGWQRLWVRLFASIALGALFLAMGSWTIFHGLLWVFFPMFEKARSPGRFVAIFGLGAAVLAALGLDYLRSGVYSSAVRRVCLIGAGLAGLIFVLAMASLAFQKSGPTDFAFMLALVGALFSAVTLASQSGKISSRALGVAVLALTFIEFSSYANRLYVDRVPHDRPTWLPNLTQFEDVAIFLRGQPGPVRVDASEVAGAFNFGDWTGIDALSGFGEEYLFPRLSVCEGAEFIGG